jgi:hypothetical protein
MNAEDCFVEVTKTSKYKDTEVVYSTGQTIHVNMENDSILHRYSDECYQYTRNIDFNYNVERITFSGNKIKNIDSTKDYAKESNKYGLVVYSNIPKLRVEKLEATNVSSGSDCYLFESKKERDSYYDVLKTKKVIDLSKNLSYNQTINVKVQSYLINPSIFNYAD